MVRLALDGRCIVLRNDAFSSSHKSYATGMTYVTHTAGGIVETRIS